MTNPTALVTGASRGIGKSIAKKLAELNYNLILIARSESGLKQVATEIENSGSKVSYYTCDLSSVQSINESLNKIFKDHKVVDVLVNNAGIWTEGSLETSVEEFNKVLAVNLSAQFVILKRIVPLMKSNGQGYIFNISSQAGKYGFPGAATYVASKFGLSGLSESLYRELAEHNIKVTAICPSWVNTDMAVEAGATIPYEEMIQTKDISKTIEWLLSLSSAVSIKDVNIECRLRIK
jgi:3-oxoacyl-[acyl-carrier protein] reductase